MEDLMTEVSICEYSSTSRSQSVRNMKEEEQRLRRRDNQRRYRKRQKDITSSFERETESLRTRIEELKRRRITLSAPGMGIPCVWSEVAKFFRLFRCGLQRTTTAQQSPQGSFVHTVMAEDLVFNAEHGRAAFMKSWLCTSLRFQDFMMNLEGMRKTKDGLLLATMTTNVTITDRTLRTVFPHLCRSGNAADDARARDFHALGDKLLGCRLTMRGFMLFQWDKTLSKVTAVTTTSDMLSPLLELLGTLEDVARVFERATISPEFQWSS
ncbi:hypothetical protein DVH05_028355 [Phytophthora capsici]|nr:hypothetical protein DVH05_028355 [Phytophthora capsici]